MFESTVGVVPCSAHTDHPHLLSSIAIAVRIKPLASLEAAVISAMIRAPMREHNINRPLAVILTAHFSGKEICNYLPMDDRSIPEEAGKTMAIFGSDARKRN